METETNQYHTFTDFSTTVDMSHVKGMYKVFIKRFLKRNLPHVGMVQ